MDASTLKYKSCVSVFTWMTKVNIKQRRLSIRHCLGSSATFIHLDRPLDGDLCVATLAPQDQIDAGQLEGLRRTCVAARTVNQSLGY